jgi:hypothetical protein
MVKFLTSREVFPVLFTLTFVAIGAFSIAKTFGFI